MISNNDKTGPKMISAVSFSRFERRALHPKKCHPGVLLVLLVIRWTPTGKSTAHLIFALFDLDQVDFLPGGWERPTNHLSDSDVKNAIFVNFPCHGFFLKTFWSAYVDRSIPWAMLGMRFLNIGWHRPSTEIETPWVTSHDFGGS